MPPLFGLAMVFVLLTYGGWNEGAYISAEVKGGPRAIVRALVLAIVVITVAYLAFVLAVLHGLGLAGMQKSNAVGADVMQAAFGPSGAQLIGLIVGIATLTSINATMIVGARTNYALGRDWPQLSFMSRWQDARNVPMVAFFVQGGIALALIAFGAMQKDGFSSMVEFTAPVFWFFFLLAGVALFVLRFREPTIARPFKVPLYPILPIVFVATCGYLFYSSVTYAQSKQAVSIALYVMLAGLVVWGLLRLTREALTHIGTPSIVSAVFYAARQCNCCKRSKCWRSPIGWRWQYFLSHGLATRCLRDGVPERQARCSQTRIVIGCYG